MSNTLYIYRDKDGNTYQTEIRGAFTVITKRNIWGDYVKTIGNVYRKRGTAENKLFVMACNNGWRIVQEIRAVESGPMSGEWKICKKGEQ